MEEFKDELSIFVESFNMHGPGAVGDDLEKGTFAERHLHNSSKMNDQQEHTKHCEKYAYISGCTGVNLHNEKALIQFKNLEVYCSCSSFSFSSQD